MNAAIPKLFLYLKCKNNYGPERDLLNISVILNVIVISHYFFCVPQQLFKWKTLFMFAGACDIIVFYCCARLAALWSEVRLILMISYVPNTC